MGFKDRVKKENARIQSVRNNSETTSISVAPDNGIGVRKSKQSSTPKPTNWQREFGDIPTDMAENYLDFGSDAANQIFMNSLNGQYKAFIGGNYDETDKKTMGYQSSMLGKTSWDLAKMVKAGIKTDDQFNKFKEKRKAWNEHVTDLTNSVHAYGSDYNIGFNSEMKMVDPTDTKKDGEQTIVYDEVGTNIQTTKEFNWNPLSVIQKAIQFHINSFLTGDQTNAKDIFYNDVVDKDKDATYRKITTYDEQSTDLVDAADKPLIKNWLDYGYSNFKNNKFDSESNALSNKERIVNLSKAGLEYLYMYGPVMQKLKAGQISAGIALRLQTEKYKAGGPENLSTLEQKLYKKNEVIIKELLNGMDSYGTNLLVEKFEKDFSSSSYYPGNTPEKKIENMNLYTNTVKVAREQKAVWDDVSDKFKTKAYGDLEADIKGDLDKVMYTYLKSENNVIPTFKQVKKSMDVGQQSYIPETGLKRVRRYPIVPGKPDIVYPLYNPRNIGQQRITNNDPTYEQVHESYIRVKAMYEEKFHDLKGEETFLNSLKTLGFGLEGSAMIGHENLDFKKDSGKNRNAITIKNMIEQSLSDGTVRAQKGKYSATINKDIMDDSELGADQKLFDKMFTDYKSNRYDVKFSRNTPLFEQSSYTFTKRGSKPESVTFYIDTKRAEEFGEEYAKATSVTGNEFAYQSQGFWDLKAYDELFQYSENPRIKTIGGMKYLIATAYDYNEGVDHEERVLLGPDKTLSIEKAIVRAKAILQESDNDIKEYLRLNPDKK